MKRVVSETHEQCSFHVKFQCVFSCEIRVNMISREIHANKFGLWNLYRVSVAVSHDLGFCGVTLMSLIRLIQGYLYLTLRFLFKWIAILDYFTSGNECNLTTIALFYKQPPARPHPKKKKKTKNERCTWTSKQFSLRELLT